MIFKRVKKLLAKNKVEPDRTLQGHSCKADAKRMETEKRAPGLIDEFINCVINIWYQIIVNFQLCFLNYFSGILCVFIQIYGFYRLMNHTH